MEQLAFPSYLKRLVGFEFDRKPQVQKTTGVSLFPITGNAFPFPEARQRFCDAEGIPFGVGVADVKIGVVWVLYKILPCFLTTGIKNKGQENGKKEA
jgi:hypothetical protein